MARGNQKQSKALSTVLREDNADAATSEVIRLRKELSAYKRTLSPYYTGEQHERMVASKAAAIKGAEWLESKMNDPEVMKKVKDFVSILGVFTTSEYAAGDGKGRKANLSAAWDALPPELKAAWSMPVVDMKYLMRGATHANNPGPDGFAVASFTPNFGTADHFRQFDVHERRRVGHMYTPEDIASHGDVIYVPAVTATAYHLFGKMDASRMEDMKRMNGENLSYEAQTVRYNVIDKLHQAKRDKVRKAFPISREFDDEKEHIVLRVKWKPDVDSGEWKDKADKRRTAIYREREGAREQMGKFSDPVHSKIRELIKGFDEKQMQKLDEKQRGL